MKKLLFALTLIFASFSGYSQCNWVQVGDSTGILMGPKVNFPTRTGLQYNLQESCCDACPATLWLNGQFVLQGQGATPLLLFTFPPGARPFAEVNEVIVYSSINALNWTTYIRITPSGEVWMWKQGNAQWFNGDHVKISLSFQCH